MMCAGADFFWSASMLLAAAFISLGDLPTFQEATVREAPGNIVENLSKKVEKCKYI